MYIKIFILNIKINFVKQVIAMNNYIKYIFNWPLYIKIPLLFWIFYLLFYNHWLLIILCVGLLLSLLVCMLGRLVYLAFSRLKHIFSCLLSSKIGICILIALIINFLFIIWCIYSQYYAIHIARFISVYLMILAYTISKHPDQKGLWFIKPNIIFQFIITCIFILLIFIPISIIFFWYVSILILEIAPLLGYNNLIVDIYNRCTHIYPARCYLTVEQAKSRNMSFMDILLWRDTTVASGNLIEMVFSFRSIPDTIDGIHYARGLANNKIYPFRDATGVCIPNPSGITFILKNCAADGIKMISGISNVDTTLTLYDQVDRSIGITRHNVNILLKYCGKFTLREPYILGRFNAELPNVTNWNLSAEDRRIKYNIPVATKVFVPFTYHEATKSYLEILNNPTSRREYINLSLQLDKNWSMARNEKVDSFTLDKNLADFRARMETLFQGSRLVYNPLVEDTYRRGTTLKAFLCNKYKIKEQDLCGPYSHITQPEQQHRSDLTNPVVTPQNIQLNTTQNQYNTAPLNLPLNSSNNQYNTSTQNIPSGSRFGDTNQLLLAFDRLVQEEEAALSSEASSSLGMVNRGVAVAQPQQYNTGFSNQMIPTQDPQHSVGFVSHDSLSSTQHTPGFISNTVYPQQYNPAYNMATEQQYNQGIQAQHSSIYNPELTTAMVPQDTQQYSSQLAGDVVPPYGTSSMLFGQRSNSPLLNQYGQQFNDTFRASRSQMEQQHVPEFTSGTVPRQRFGETPLLNRRSRSPVLDPFINRR